MACVPSICCALNIVRIKPVITLATNNLLKVLYFSTQKKPTCKDHLLSGLISNIRRAPKNNPVDIGCIERGFDYEVPNATTRICVPLEITKSSIVMSSNGPKLTKYLKKVCSPYWKSAKRWLNGRTRTTSNTETINFKPKNMTPAPHPKRRTKPEQPMPSEEPIPGLPIPGIPDVAIPIVPEFPSPDVPEVPPIEPIRPKIPLPGKPVPITPDLPMPGLPVPNTPETAMPPLDMDPVAQMSETVDCNILKSYKRVTSASNSCVFPKCRNSKVSSVPPFIRTKALIKNKIYIDQNAHVCKWHLKNGNWDRLKGTVSAFTINEVKDMIELMENVNSDAANITTTRTEKTNIQKENTLMLGEQIHNPNEVQNSSLCKLQIGENNLHLNGILQTYIKDAKIKLTKKLDEFGSFLLEIIYAGDPVAEIVETEMNQTNDPTKE